jgi:hypothetical protein
VVLAREDGGKLDLIVAKNAGSPGNPAPSVTVTGAPAELTLWAMGRGRAAHVSLDGTDEAVARLSAWRA